MQRSRRSILTLLLLLAASLLPLLTQAQSLKPSRNSLNRQNLQARQHDFTFLKNPAHVARFVDRGWLVPVPGNAHYSLDGVSFPFARPEVRLFIERLSRQYRSACGEKLVVTSLTRPRSHTPWNSSIHSVHPTGMALDLRRSRRSSCRNWLEKTLLSLEGSRVLEASRERFPPHYHLAVFPKPYRRYVERLKSGRGGEIRVASGDTLWSIARRHRVEIDALRQVNGLSSNRIYPGQTLALPVED
ncbi:MAG: DUF5715 family protein [Acidobacteriota bacterium]